jgi:hypothetical protein
VDYIGYFAVAMTSSIPPSIEKGRDTIQRVDDIIKDPSTMYGNPHGIAHDVIIVFITLDGTDDSYTIATHAPGAVYPLVNECYIHRKQTPSFTNQFTSHDGVCWVIEGTESFHDPYTTVHPHVLVDGIHVIFFQLPIFDNVIVGDYDIEDYDGSSWGEGSVISEGNLSAAETE